MNIDRSFRLPDLEYFSTPQTKTGMCIHHTVGGTARSTMDWWLRDGAQVGTAYIIERDGTIFEVFDPKAWAWQFGLKWPATKKTAFEKRFIGIELASEGGLVESNGNLYCFDRITEKTKKSRDEAFDYGKDFRGFRYFDRYESAQLDSLIELLNHLLDEFSIRRRHPNKPLSYYGDWLENFKGIIGHTMVRKDKSDPIPDETLWERIREECGVRAVKVSHTGEESFDYDKLKTENLQLIVKLHPTTGSLVKGLLQALSDEPNPAFIRLLSIKSNGKAVEYEHVEGSKATVKKIARAMGLIATETRITLQFV